MAWFGESFRKVHILYVSPQWSKRRGAGFDGAQYAEALASAGVDCVELYTKDHHGTCYFPCSSGLPYTRDIVGELLPELRKRDLRFIAYVSVCFDNYALGIHPEWRAVNDQGDPYKTGPFSTACLNSPYADYVLQQIHELAAAYQADGYWLDIIPLARDVPQAIWMTMPMPAPCYCLSCQRKYEQETGERLPRWGQGDAGQRERAFAYLVQKTEQFLAQARATVQAYNPQALVTYNGADSPGDPIKCGDLVSIEGHAPNYARQSFIARWGKASGKPFEILTAGGLPHTDPGGGWNGFDQKPSLVMQLESAIGLAHGGSAVIGLAPYPDGSIDPGQIAGFRQVFEPVRALEPWLRDPQGVADAGLVLAPKARNASALWGQMQDGAEAFHEAMLSGHTQFDIVQPGDDLGRYQLLVLAEQAALGEREIDQLRAYVQAGGKLLATGNASLWDENGRRRPDFGLADVFGLSYRRDPGLPFAYLRLKGGLAGQVTGVPIYVQEPPLEVELNGAHALADLVYPEATRTDATTVLWGDPPPDADQVYPGICEHSYGQGLCRYVSWPMRARGLPKAWIKRLMAVLVCGAVSDPVLTTTAPAGVEVVLNRQGGRYIVNLVNHLAGDPDRLAFAPNALALANIEVSVRLSRLSLDGVRTVYAPPDQALAYEVRDGWLRVVAPPLKVHSVLAIE